MQKSSRDVVTATYLPSLASIAHDNIIDSSEAVGELASNLFMYLRCGLLLAQPLDLIVSSLFSFI